MRKLKNVEFECCIDFYYLDGRILFTCKNISISISIIIVVGFFPIFLKETHIQEIMIMEMSNMRI